MDGFLGWDFNGYAQPQKPKTVKCAIIAKPVTPRDTAGPPATQQALEGVAQTERPPPEQGTISDQHLAMFQGVYGNDAITRHDIWHYVYGVMHAPDWRETYANDLKKSYPRIPLAADFEAFRAAGEHLMAMHAFYEDVPEQPKVVCLLDGDNVETTSGELKEEFSDPAGDWFRIKDKLRWGQDQDGQEDRTKLAINRDCILEGIPAQAEDYKISERSPLAWAITQLEIKTDRDSGITLDPNGWEDWADEPFNLVRHLRRLVYISVESAAIIKELPPSLDGPVGQEVKVDVTQYF